MSRGFVKESDQEDLPLIPPRAPLPPGVTNYVTPTGLAALEAERHQLEAERAALPTTNEDEHRRAATVLDGKLALLQRRIVTARVIDPATQPAGEVRFGATVRLRHTDDGSESIWRIVGVDEADVKTGRLAFTSPVIKRLSGARVGDRIDLPMGGRRRGLEVLAIVYE